MIEMNYSESSDAVFHSPHMNQGIGDTGNFQNLEIVVIEPAQLLIRYCHRQCTDIFFLMKFLKKWMVTRPLGRPCWCKYPQDGPYGRFPCLQAG